MCVRVCILKKALTSDVGRFSPPRAPPQRYQRVQFVALRPFVFAPMSPLPNERKK